MSQIQQNENDVEDIAKIVLTRIIERAHIVPSEEQVANAIRHAALFLNVRVDQRVLLETLLNHFENRAKTQA